MIKRFKAWNKKRLDQLMDWLDARVEAELKAQREADMEDDSEWKAGRGNGYGVGKYNIELYTPNGLALRYHNVKHYEYNVGWMSFKAGDSAEIITTLPYIITEILEEVKVIDDDVENDIQ